MFLSRTHDKVTTIQRELEIIDDEKEMSDEKKS